MASLWWLRKREGFSVILVADVGKLIAYKGPVRRMTRPLNAA